ncbi:hypothetical protein [Paraburkholderia sp. BL25I1N1]|uniref:hypothetical protein n=1 Tax=Paraburkholderia sp. BL25I1N1 TaxID=1938804 RepID=UPI002158BD42|nr:hypothetical protein [Paraburkholderia sp. BL25I1N1]
MRDLLLEAVERDMALRDKLLFAARAANASDLPSMKTAVRQATRIRDHSTGAKPARTATA